MKRFIEIIFCISILLISYSCTQDSNRKTAYELQERCGKSAVHWSEQHNEVIDYKAHYNSSLNKCIVYATLAPIVGSNVITSYYMLYDVNAHSKLGQYKNIFVLLMAKTMGSNQKKNGTALLRK